jgi:hypothetical protein
MRRLSTLFFQFHAAVGLLAFLLVAGAAYGQSLGDVARENRDQKAAAASTQSSKVITNKDVQKDADEDSDAPKDAPPQPSPASAAASRNAAAQRAAEQHAAAQWKQKILGQESRIALLQARADRIQSTIQSENPNGTYEVPVSTRYQARQLERLKETQDQLVQQKRILEDMQEAARHAGMHTPVYDP